MKTQEAAEIEIWIDKRTRQTRDLTIKFECLGPAVLEGYLVKYDQLTYLQCFVYYLNYLGVTF